MYQHDLERGAWIRGIVLCMARRLICVGPMIPGPRPISYKMRTQVVAEKGGFVLQSYGEIIWESTKGWRCPCASSYERRQACAPQPLQDPEAVANFRGTLSTSNLPFCSWLYHMVLAFYLKIPDFDNGLEFECGGSSHEITTLISSSPCELRDLCQRSSGLRT
jgi:hypothetical protein